MFNKKLLIIGAVLVLGAAAVKLYAHCQIPCGIYDDPARFTLMEEHVTTIEKSMKEIGRLSEDPAKNANQIVRWVKNKEAHAGELSEIVTYYFMAQRLKPADPGDSGKYEKYVSQLTMLHGILFYSMKAKQTTDPAHIENLRGLIAEYKASYFAK